MIYPIAEGARAPLHPLCTDTAGLIDGSGPTKVTPSAFLAPPSNPPEDDTAIHVARGRNASTAEARLLLTRQTRIVRRGDPLETALDLSDLVDQELYIRHSEVLQLRKPTAVATEIEIVTAAP
ncbi:hypothetical protein [Sorangium sp. So ce861]|uniref:hypothetical protein n=1 Tax=Sorangium sp. So ce861 TaxID=3133323 RepID=UPI003F5EEB2B